MYPAEGEWGDDMGMDMMDMDMDMMDMDMDDMREMWDDLNVEIEMTDKGVQMSMEGMSVEMQDGPEGASMRIVLGASNLAASAAVLASVAALY